jgi:hypothetical protein
MSKVTRIKPLLGRKSDIKAMNISSVDQAKTLMRMNAMNVRFHASGAPDRFV